MISFEIPGLPKMANGGHGHWKGDHYGKKKWKDWTAKCLLGKAPKIPYRKVKCIFTRLSSVEPDFDGLVHGFKPIRDAIVLCGVVSDDSSRHMQAEYRWERAPAKKGKIRVEIFPLEE